MNLDGWLISRVGGGYKPRNHAGHGEKRQTFQRHAELPIQQDAKQKTAARPRGRTAVSKLPISGVGSAPPAA